MTTHSPAIDTEPYRQYAHLLVQHHRLLSQGKDQDLETESIEEEMGRLWDRFDAIQQRSLSGLGSDLSWVRRRFQAAPRGRRAEDVTSQDLKALVEARELSDWHALLHHLRVCSAKLLPFQVAYLRGLAWSAVGFPNLAAVFYDAAAGLEPSNGLIAVLALRATDESDPATALERARQITSEPFRHPAVLVALAAAMLIRDAWDEPSFDRARALVVLRDTLGRHLDPPSEAERAMICQFAAFALEVADEPEEAIKCYEQALRMAPNSQELRVGLGLLLYGRDDERAAELLTDAARSQYPLVWPYLFLAHFYLCRRQFDQSLVCCTLAWPRATTEQVRAELLEWSAICQSELVYPGEAVRAMFVRAIEIDPANERFAKNLRAFEAKRKGANASEYEIPLWQSVKEEHHRGTQPPPNLSESWGALTVNQAIAYQSA
jgi:tetratricopeptide (TPR) repeat protein